MARPSIANGDIYPARFVKLDATAVGKVLQCGSNEKAFGISDLGTRRNQYVDSSGKAAAAGEPVTTFVQGEVCGLQLGGTVTVGDYLKSDANGKGVTSSADLDDVGAIALQSGVSGEVIQVKVHIAERSV